MEHLLEIPNTSTDITIGLLSWAVGEESDGRCVVLIDDWSDEMMSLGCEKAV